MTRREKRSTATVWPVVVGEVDVRDIFFPAFTVLYSSGLLPGQRQVGMNLPRTASTSAARFFGRRGSARHAKGHTRNTRKAVYGERSISSPKRCLAKQQLKTTPLKPLALTESPEHHVQLVAGRPGPSNATFHALSGESQVGDSQHAHSSPSKRRKRRDQSYAHYSPSDRSQKGRATAAVLIETNVPFTSKQMEQFSKEIMNGFPLPQLYEKRTLFAKRQPSKLSPSRSHLSQLHQDLMASTSSLGVRAKQAKAQRRVQVRLRHAPDSVPGPYFGGTDEPSACCELIVPDQVFSGMTRQTRQAIQLFVAQRLKRYLCIPFDRYFLRFLAHSELKKKGAVAGTNASTVREKAALELKRLNEEMAILNDYYGGGEDGSVGKRAIGTGVTYHAVKYVGVGVDKSLGNMNFTSLPRSVSPSLPIKPVKADEFGPRLPSPSLYGRLTPGTPGFYRAPPSPSLLQRFGVSTPSGIKAEAPPGGWYGNFPPSTPGEGRLIPPGQYGHLPPSTPASQYGQYGQYSGKEQYLGAPFTPGAQQGDHLIERRMIHSRARSQGFF